MRTCPYCHFQNRDDAIRCLMCFAVLTDSAAVLKSEPTVANLNIPKGLLEKIAATRPKQTVYIGANSIALYIDDSPDPIIIQLTNQAIFGRYVPNSSTHPSIDLTPYDGLKKGISRMHAVIRRTESGLTLQDLASSNGTWLNGTKLEPYIPEPIKSGDRLLLGEIAIEVKFQM